MANDISTMAIMVLRAIPLDGDNAETALIHSAISTIDAANAANRQPLQPEWDAIMKQIGDLTGQPVAGWTDPTTIPAGGSGEAISRGDGTNVPTAKPEDVVGTAANPDPAGVSPGPMFDEAHGAPGSTNVSLSTGGTVNTGGSALAPLTADEQKALDDHPTTPPSEEARQANPINPDTGAAAGMAVINEPTDAEKAFNPAQVDNNPAAPAPGPEDKVPTAGPDTGPFATSPSPTSGTTDSGTREQGAFDAEYAKVKADLADFEAQVRRDLNLKP
jgi:hypothetical protein